MRALFPGGIEETRDARGRLEVAAYAAPPLTLPADLGPWRIEPVEDMRARIWREDHHGTLIGGRLWVGPPSEQPRKAPRRRDRAGPRVRLRRARDDDRLPRAPLRSPRRRARCSTSAAVPACSRLPPCGSGIAPVYACDVDPLAVSAARENVRANDVDVEVFEADAASDDLPAADLWLANLAKGPLSDVLARPDAPARAIVSGLFADDLPRMPGWRIEREVERAGWHALLVARA